MLRGNFSFLLGWKSSVELKQPFKLPALQHRVNYAENDRARNPSGSIQAEAFKAKSSLRQQLLVFFFLQLPSMLARSRSAARFASRPSWPRRRSESIAGPSTLDGRSGRRRKPFGVSFTFISFPKNLISGWTNQMPSWWRKGICVCHHLSDFSYLEGICSKAIGVDPLAITFL